MSNPPADQVGYERTLIQLSDLALEHLLASGRDEYAPLKMLKGSKGLYPLLPSRTKGKVKELLSKAMMDPHYDQVIHTGGAKFADLEALKGGEETGIQVKSAVESNGYALVKGLHLDTDTWHLLHIRPAGWIREGEQHQPMLYALVPPGTFDTENTGWSEGLGHHVRIPLDPNARSRHSYLREYLCTLEEVTEQLARGL